jgi:hypothetical protein
MRRFAILCLAVVVGSLAHSQQPPQWRPSIADDNKAATWEDTISFIDTTTGNKGGYLLPHHSNKAFHGYAEDAILSIKSPMKCEVELLERVGVEGEDISELSGYWLAVERQSIDLSKVDPLSIEVTTLGNSPSIFSIHMTGRNNDSIGSISIAYYKLHNWKDDRVKAEVPCTPGLGKCQMSQPALLEERISFLDLETAKRVARGLLHASVLCGGAKSVSPF